jgi:hypothetical protein
VPDALNPERVSAIAAAARAPVPPQTAARVARAIEHVVSRIAAGGLTYSFETEPATFLAVAHEDAAR